MIITVPDFAVVTVLTDEIGLVMHVQSSMKPGGPLILVNRDNPEMALALIESQIQNRRSCVVALKHGHPKLRRQISRLAHAHGAHSTILLDKTEQPEHLPKEKHDQIIDVRGQSIDTIVVARSRMPYDLRDRKGPFDFIGDIHGCADEFEDLLIKLGHARKTDQGFELVRHPKGRTVALVGDLTDRGPRNLDALRLAYRLHQEFGAIVVLGNHDHKLMRWLRGANIKVAAGLAMTIAEMEKISPDERALLGDWLASLGTHYTLDGGKVILAHAGLAEEHHNRASKGADSFALYGAKSNERDEHGQELLDEHGFPQLVDWAASYIGKPTVVHGHIVTNEPRMLNNVVSIDTGCVFGGALTAYRYPERRFVSVKAKSVHFTTHGQRVLA